MNGAVRGRSASPKPLNGAHAGPRKGTAMRSRSPSRSHRSRSPARSYSRSPSRPMSISQSPERQDAQSTALSIANLSENVRESHLRQIFQWYGKVQDIYLPSGTGNGARVGYVVFATGQEAAKAALHMGAGQIDGVTVEVHTCALPLELARRSDERPNGRYDRRDSYRAEDRYPASDLRSRFGPPRDPESRRRSPPRHARNNRGRWNGPRPRSPPRTRSRSPRRSSRASPSYT